MDKFAELLKSGLTLNDVRLLGRTRRGWAQLERQERDQPRVASGNEKSAQT